MRRPLLLWAALLLGAVATQPAHAEPWVEVGDRTLRSDIEILAARGLIDGLVTTWPIPAGQLSSLTDPGRLDNQPEYVKAAAKRVLDRLIGEGQPDGLKPEADARFTNSPDTIRDFGSTARNEVDVRAGLVWDSDNVSAGLKVGDQSRLNGSQTKLAFDGSYLSLHLDNWQLYGGMVDQWYGAGWTSSLILSNNARPFPKIGIMRNNPHAFETPWLSWLGPWQLNLFVGLLNDTRVANNTAYTSLRVTFAPVQGLEIGLTRAFLACGSGHSCNPVSSFFHFGNSDANPNNTGDSATIEFKYTRPIGSVSVSPYVQFYNRDTGPFVHSYTSYLFGTTQAGPLGSDGSQWRITAEYADTIPTLNWFSFGKPFYGAAYNSYRYPQDGFHYYDRSLGFSLDSDSRLFSLAGQITDTRGWTYRLVYYRANINTTQLANGAGPYDPANARNVVSAQPVQFDQVEAGLAIPLRSWQFDFTVRGQDAQVYPKPGGKMAGEVGISYRF